MSLEMWINYQPTLSVAFGLCPSPVLVCFAIRTPNASMSLHPFRSGSPALLRQPGWRAQYFEKVWLACRLPHAARYNTLRLSITAFPPCNKHSLLLHENNDLSPLAQFTTQGLST